MHSHPRHIVNRVLGGSEMLIWDVDNVIVGIDLQVCASVRVIQHQKRLANSARSFRKEIILG
jgi:hypothetical protein